MTIDLIDARRGLYNKCSELFGDANIAAQIYRYLCDGIEECEEAEPIKHAHWESKFENGKVNTYCSACNCITNGLYHFCPNCGAKMDEVEE